MSAIFGARPASQTVNRYTSVDVQTSSQGVAIPIVAGANRIGSNLIQFLNFQSTPAKGGGKGGKGGGKGATAYDYSAAVALGLCEGPVNVGTVWADSSVTTLGSLGLGLYSGTADQGPAAWIEANYPTQALAYSQTAYLFSSNYSFGTSPSVPQHNVEVLGFLYGSVPESMDGADINMADWIPLYITSTQFGLDPDATYIDPTSRS